MKMRRIQRAARIDKSRSAHLAEELERRVMLASAVAAFVPQVTFGVGANPFSVESSDLNRDGRTDMVVANLSSNTLGVLIGNGNGTFQGQVTFAAGTFPISVVATDVNGDGKSDLVCGNLGSNSASVLLGNGDGTFQGQRTFDIIMHPRSVAVSDLNRDGKPDIAVADGAGNAVSVLLGNGDGSFQGQMTFVAGAYPHSVAICDVNGDGKPDLVTANAGGNSAGVLLGNGDGTFGLQQTFGTGANATCAVPLDANGDGKVDIAVTSYDNNSASILLGNGDGTFGTQRVFPAGTAPIFASTADLNADGRTDLIVANFNSSPGSVSVLLGNGDGAFGAQVTLATGAKPRAVATADLNSDGRLDLVVTNDNSAGSVSVLIADTPPAVLSINRLNPVGTITSGSSVVFSVMFSEQVTGVDATDFALAQNGVAVAMPLVVSGGGAAYTVMVSGISGTGSLGLNLVDDRSITDAAGNGLEPGRMISFSSRQVGGSGLAVPADVNHDGILDLVLGGPGISVALGNGDGSFKPPVNSSSMLGIYSIAVADLNGDGIPDVVASEQGCVGVLLGNGNGAFGTQTTFVTAGTGAPNFAVSDVNLDGRPDLITAPQYSGPISMLIGNGNGTFQPPQTFAATGVSAFAASDVNGDGRPDIVVATSSASFTPDTLGVMAGNGNGTFQAQKTFAASNDVAYSIRVADMNGDGRADLVVAYPGLGRVGVLLGNGNGTFLTTKIVSTDFVPIALAVGDINADGKLDAVTVNRSANDVSVLLGNGGGSFVGQQTFAGGGYTPSVSLCDLNHDGRMDVVVGVRYGTPVILMGAINGSLVGQTYSVVPLLNTIEGTQDADQITLVQDPDHAHIDWTLGSVTAQVAINDPSGLTIDGLGSNDLISLFVANGSALPHRLQLSGVFTIVGLHASPFLSATALDIGRSTVFIDDQFEPGISDQVRSCLLSGYNGGAWNGTSTGGIITSSDAAGNALRNTGIGWADSADGTGVNTVVNSVELKYILYGDANLDGVVDSSDAILMTRNYLVAGKSAWDQGNFNYDSAIDMNDALALQKNYGARTTDALVGTIPAVTLPSGPGTAATTTTSSTGTTSRTAEAVLGGSVARGSIRDTEDGRGRGKVGQEKGGKRKR